MERLLHVDGRRPRLALMRAGDFDLGVIDLDGEAASVSPAMVLEKPINPAHLRAVVRGLETESARG